MTLNPFDSRTFFILIPLLVSFRIGPSDSGKKRIFILNNSLSHSLKCGGPFFARLFLPLGRHGVHQC